MIIKCDQCGASVFAEGSFSGVQVRCPNCGAKTKMILDKAAKRNFIWCCLLLVVVVVAAIIVGVQTFSSKMADAYTPDDVKWTYHFVDGAIVLGGRGGFGAAVPINTIGALEIPEIIDGVPVREIGKWAFSGRSNLTSVTIPSSVTNIGEYAFDLCGGLTSVTVPSSVTSIERYAFSGCSGLKTFVVESANSEYTSINGLLCSKDGKTLIAGVNGDVKIPDGVKIIGICAFSGCSGLRSVTIPPGVTRIRVDAFSGTKLLKDHPDGLVIVDRCLLGYKGMCSGEVVIPDGVRLIADCAFSDCNGLKSVTIPSSVTSIGWCAFSGCGELESVTIPSSVTNIGWYAFLGTKLLKDHHDGLVIVDNCLLRFKGTCSGNVVIPDGVRLIAGSAFHECRGLKSVTIPMSVTSIGCGAFFDCSELKSVAIPSSVTSIEDAAFVRCSGLTSMTIPPSVTSIREYAFSGCSGLKSVTIPSSVTSIERNAFRGCGGLASVTMPSSMTNFVRSAFGQGGTLLSPTNGMTTVVFGGNGR